MTWVFAVLMASMPSVPSVPCPAPASHGYVLVHTNDDGSFRCEKELT